jgi:hypothetical protein
VLILVHVALQVRYTPLDIHLREVVFAGKTAGFDLEETRHYREGSAGAKLVNVHYVPSESGCG